MNLEQRVAELEKRVAELEKKAQPVTIKTGCLQDKEINIEKVATELKKNLYRQAYML